MDCTNTNSIYDEEAKTVKEIALKHLVKNGMFANDANAVLKAYQDRTPEMDGRWDDFADSDPFQLIVCLKIGINSVALEYIEENIPNAWFKPIFEK